jgi:hypothetical protein
MSLTTIELAVLGVLLAALGLVGSLYYREKSKLVLAQSQINELTLANKQWSVASAAQNISIHSLKTYADIKKNEANDAYKRISPQIEKNNVLVKHIKTLLASVPGTKTCSDSIDELKQQVLK